MSKLMYMLFFVGIATFGNAQCANWIGNEKESEATDAHSIYRSALKTEDYSTAFENWQKAYDIAPAADGKRDYHMTDGAKIYLHKFQNSTDDAEKKEFASKVVALYDQAVECYRAKSISLKCGDTEECVNQRISYLRGRQGYDMYYSLNSPYSKNFEVLQEAMNLGGNDVEYIVFDPLAKIAVYQYQKGKIEKAQALEIYQSLEKIAQHNIENNADYGTYFEQAWKASKVHYAPVESEIFDCEFFKNKLRPEYDANPDDKDVIKKVLAKLKAQGCADDDELVKELDGKWKTYAAAANAQMLSDDKENNPAKYAKKLRQEGDFQGAISYYEKAIAKETDNVKKASYLLSVAKIQYSKFKKYSDARNNAREAAKLRPNWGDPYITIGDMYGSSARGCGDDWAVRLAIIAAMEKYEYAKSIDPEAAEEAQSRLSKYYASLPEKQEGFMRKVKAGQSVKVPCWIGETVRVRFK